MPSSDPNSQAASSSWSELPPWSGFIETTGDALLILEAARRGLIPRVRRRLVDSERKMITSGSVFVFDEDESGIKRWTDGFFWSPSRILGNFLLYRETEKRGVSHRSSRNGDEPSEAIEPSYGLDGVKLENHTLSRPKGDQAIPMDKARERLLVGSLTNSYKFKSSGMMKKTFSLTIGGVAQHLISYYKVDDVEAGRLRSPSSLPELAALEITPDYLDKTHFRNPPRVEIGPDGIPRYRGEGEDEDSSSSGGHPSAHSPSVSMGSPPESSGSKRGRRHDPYTSVKRNRKVKPQRPSSPEESESLSPTTSPTSSTSLAQYHEPTSPSVVMQPQYAPYSNYYAPISPGYPVPQAHMYPPHGSYATGVQNSYSGYPPDQASNIPPPVTQTAPVPPVSYPPYSSTYYNQHGASYNHVVSYPPYPPYPAGAQYGSDDISKDGHESSQYDTTETDLVDGQHLPVEASA